MSSLRPLSTLATTPTVTPTVTATPPAPPQVVQAALSEENGLEDVKYSILQPVDVSGTIFPAAPATGSGWEELQKLISDSFLFMHDRLQEIETSIESLSERLDKAEQARKNDAATVMSRLRNIEVKMQKANLKRVPVMPVQRVVPVTRISSAGGQAASRAGPSHQSNFPFRSSAQMERVAQSAHLNGPLKKRLNDMFLDGKRYGPQSLRSWISDNVLLEYSPSLNTDKKHISESKFIAMIQQCWTKENLSVTDFENMYEDMLQEIRAEQGNQKRTEEAPEKVLPETANDQEETHICEETDLVDEPPEKMSRIEGYDDMYGDEEIIMEDVAL